MKYFLIIATIFFSILFTQNKAISSTVIDENGDPIRGVNIYSTEFGTTSNDQGFFTIEMKNNEKITFSHISYNTTIYYADSIKNTVIMTSKTIFGEKIIVKGELRNKDILHTPASVSVLQSNELRQNDKIHFQNIIESISNLNYNGGTSRPRYFQIRGIGERSQYAGESPPNFSVGFNIDGIDFSGIGMAGSLFDIQQVEIFKGPQSSVNGANSLAGQINLISNKPTPYFTGDGQLILGNDNMKNIGLAVGGPIFKKLLFRLAIQQSFQNGFRKNTFLNKNDTNKKDEFNSRAKIKWQIFPKLIIELTQFNANLNNGYDIWAVNNNKEFITYSDSLGYDSQKSTANSLKLNFNDILKINSFYEYTNSNNEIEHSYDGDWGNNDFWLADPYYFNQDSTGWAYSFWDKTIRKRSKDSHEFRTSSNISNISTIIGFYVSNLYEVDNAKGYLFGGDATDLKSKFSLHNSALYAQVSIKDVSDFSSTINVRVEESQTYYESTGSNWGYPIPEISEKLGQFFSCFRISFTYSANQNLNIYSNLSKGYKIGGINQNPKLSNSNRFFDPEYNTNFEIGSKFRSKKLALNMSVFNMSRSDQQIQISSQQESGNPNSFIFYTSNAASGWNRGLELDSKLFLNKNLTFLTSLGLLKTHINEFIFPINDTSFDSLGNREQAMAPSYNFSLGINYLNNSGFFASLELTKKDSYYFSDSHDQMNDSYQIINSNIGIKKKGYSFSIWGKNIFDRRYSDRGFYFANEPIWNMDIKYHDYPDKLYLSYANPIEYGIMLKTHF